VLFNELQREKKEIAALKHQSAEVQELKQQLALLQRMVTPERFVATSLSAQSGM
jgi:hypothetical protein